MAIGGWAEGATSPAAVNCQLETVVNLDRKTSKEKFGRGTEAGLNQQTTDGELKILPITNLRTPRIGRWTSYLATE